MATYQDYLYILMRDVQGEKAPGKLMAVLSAPFTSGPKTVQVLRGELLTQIPRRGPPHNFRTTKDSSVTLYGGEDDEYVSPLNGRDLQLLGAIEKPYDRFAVFSEDSKLEWGNRLMKGHQVYVKLPGDNATAPTWSAGVVRHVGGVGSLPGRNFGVEIKDSRYLGKGSTNGFFGGYRYFECDQDCGLFVSLDKLAAKPPHQVPHSAIPPQQPKSSTLPGANPHIQGSCADKPPVFKINDRVIVYNKKKEPMHGTVRWTGRDMLTRTLDTNHIGIETDWAVITHLFPKALTGITHLFKAISGQRLVLPEHLVFREELAHTRTHLAQDVDLSDPAAAAREEGVSKRQFMAEQERALKAAEDTKRKEDRKKAAEDKIRRAAEEKKEKRGSVVPTVPKPMENKDDIIEELKQEITSLQAENESLQQRIETNQAEQSQHIQLLEAEKQQLLQQYSEREHTTSQEMAEKEEQIQQLQRDLQTASKLAEEREMAVRRDLSARITALVRELEGKTKELAAHNTEVWRIPANRVNIGSKIGTGGWGEVLEGTVRVAVKRLHEEIAYPIHIEKMEREMKLLAEVRHPNLVQFIGAIFDEQNNKSPPILVTELLDMNLRQAYEKNQLGPGNRLSIFMDIALALDYLHQRYDPIIHRDVSAPNVLLQRMPNHQWKGKVSDLGSANFLQHAQTSGEGCVLYSAPEVIPRAYNPRQEQIAQTTKIDVYSYGVLLCEVITSTFPSVKNYWGMLKDVEKAYPQFHDLITNCTQESPDNRPTMAQVLNIILLEDDKIPKF